MSNIVLIIPVYNGAEVLSSTFSKILDFVNNSDILCQVIFVNDGSIDKTQELLQDFKIKNEILPIIICGYEVNKGKGYAIKYASKYVKGDSSFVGFTDAELPYGLSKLLEVQTNLSKYDIVVGSRKENEEKQYSFYRSVMRKIFRLFIPREVTNFQDTQCGFKFFRTEVFQSIFSRVTTFRWVFDIELFIIAVIYKYSIYELTVSIDRKLLKKKGGVSLYKHSFHILADLFKIKQNLKSGVYEK
ncbi:MAG: glycosyltransferase [Candidatus Magasanikbacteria bacterium]